MLERLQDIKFAYFVLISTKYFTCTRKLNLLAFASCGVNNESEIPQILPESVSCVASVCEAQFCFCVTLGTAGVIHVHVYVGFAQCICSEVLILLVCGKTK